MTTKTKEYQQQVIENIRKHTDLKISDDIAIKTHNFLIQTQGSYPNSYIKEAVKKVVKKAKEYKMSEITNNKIMTLFEALTDRLSYLYGRWQDEKEYEEFQEYINNLCKFFEKVKKEHKISNAIFVKMQKRPFQFVFDFEGYTVNFYINSKKLGWKAKKIIKT